MIGILDWDLLSTKKFCNYNFGVLLVSSYYLEQGIKCRLILDISYDNLKRYNKIFVFKDYKTKSVPLNFIPKYLFLIFIQKLTRIFINHYCITFQREEKILS